MTVLQRAMCLQCGAPLPVTEEALAVDCDHCSATTPLYDVAAILRDGVKVYSLADKFDEQALAKFRERHSVPEEVEAPRRWCPHWYFKGEVEAFISGRRYTIGLGGDRVERVTHRKSRKIPGRILPASLFYPGQETELKRFDLDRQDHELKVPSGELFVLAMDQEEALECFEDLLKTEFLRERDFRTDRCDRFEITCKNFQQALVYLPFRCWRFSHRWVGLYCHSGETVAPAPAPAPQGGRCLEGPKMSRLR